MDTIKLSIDLIKKRLNRINEIINDFKENKINEQYYFESTRLRFIEIGEESKKINDFLLEHEGEWDDVISKSYNFRVSLTHYYQTMYNEVVQDYIDNNLTEFGKN